MDRERMALPEAGFVGRFFPAERPVSDTVIVMTGSDGGLSHAEYTAGLFAAEGINALALAYFGYPGLAKTLEMIPVEYIENAVRWLKGCVEGARIALYGVSKGAEYALTAATLLAGIEAVVAVVPNYYVAEGIGKGRSRAGHSSWCYRGKELPYVPIPGGTMGLVGRSLCARQLEVAGFYEQAEKNGIPDTARIPVEKCQARILLLSAGRDSIWPSARAGEVLAERLRGAEYPYVFRHQCFEKASHILNPVPAKKAGMYRLVFRAERADPKACGKAREQAFRAAVEWMRSGGAAAWNEG